MGLTTDPDDPDLTHGVDPGPVPQAKTYLVLSDAEIAQGFVRPVRRTYLHYGPPGPRNPLVSLTREQVERHGSHYVAYETYPPDSGAAVGRYWTQAQLDAADKGCGVATTMDLAIAQTYARQPTFYGATYCVGCHQHLPVGARGEFVWEDGSRVGT